MSALAWYRDRDARAYDRDFMTMRSLGSEHDSLTNAFGWSLSPHTPDDLPKP